MRRFTCRAIVKKLQDVRILRRLNKTMHTVRRSLSNQHAVLDQLVRPTLNGRTVPREAAFCYGIHRA